MSGSTLLAAAGATSLAVAASMAPALEDADPEPPSIGLLALAALCLGLSGLGALLGAALQVYSPTKLTRRLGKDRGPDVLRELARYEPSDQAAMRVLEVLGLVAATVLVWVGFPAARGAALAVLGFAAVVVVGALPVRIAERRAESLLLQTLGLVRRLRWTLLVAAFPVRVVTVAILRVLRVPENDLQDREAVAEEILAAVGDSSDEGGIEQERRDWIEAIVAMKEMSASEIKTPRTDLIAFDEQQPLIEAVRGAVKHGFSRYPVYRNTLDDVVGVFYVKDALGLLGNDKRDEFRTVGELMRPALFAPESRSIVDLLREFRTEKVQIAVLLDEYGGTAGIVSIEDILEEIFGEIVDEHDPDEDEEICVAEDGQVVEASGRARVVDVNDEIAQPVPIGEDYDTLAGFVISRLDRIPKPGETVRTDGFEVEILAADDRRIGRMRLRVMPETEAAEASRT